MSDFNPAPPLVTPPSPIVSEPISPTPVVTPITPKKIPTFLLFIIPVLVIIAVISIYVLIQARKMYQESVATPSPVATPVASVDPTADWQTYSNDKMKITLKYPSNANLKVFTYDSNDLNFAINTAQYDPLFFNVAYLPTSELQDWYLKAYSSTRQDTQTAPELQKGLDIDGHASYYSDFNLEVAGKVRYIFIQADKGIYQIHMPISSNELQYQILSTFKFADSQNVDEKESLTNVVKNKIFAYSQTYGVKNKDQIIVKINTLEGDYAVGSVSFSQEIEGPGGQWFATKIAGTWTLVIDTTQEPPSCKIMKQYGFPQDIYGECNDY